MIEPDDCDLDSSGEAPRLVLRGPFRWDRADLFDFRSPSRRVDADADLK